MNSRLVLTFAAILAVAGCNQQSATQQQQQEQPSVVTANPKTPQQTAATTATAAGVTLISAVQGSGEASPMAGQSVTIEAIVTASYQSTGIRGFYIQEEISDYDQNGATSEGMFVFDSETMVTPGQKVRVTGPVEEYKGQTQIGKGVRTEIIGEGETEPIELLLPLDVNKWEQYENMLVQIPQSLTVTETYGLGRYGEVVLSSAGRIYHSTQLERPGDKAKAIEESNKLRRVLLDDADTKQNPKPVSHLGTNKTLRSGSTVENLNAVISYMFDQYRLLPVGEIAFVQPERPAAPERSGSLRVANFNVHNYFNGDGKGGGYPTSRGATTQQEFERQRAKVINALAAINADIFGLNEVENDGYGPDSAIQDIVNGLNEKAGGQAAWRFVQPSFELGTDQIKVALIYNSNVVEPVGEPVTTNEEPFGSRRPPLAQAFAFKESGEVLTVATNHFKSKGCGNNADGANADNNDGQGCWNEERRQAAITLANWLARDPTKSNDPDVLVIGDLNAYAMEDPLHEMQQAGFTNLAVKFGGPTTYSYVYGGEYGSLDHALANQNLVTQVKNTTIWHINSDEPTILDYEMEFNPPELYTPEVWKSSDHDPIIVDLDLGA